MVPDSLSGASDRRRRKDASRGTFFGWAKIFPDLPRKRFPWHTPHHAGRQGFFGGTSFFMDFAVRSAEKALFRPNFLLEFSARPCIIRLCAVYRYWYKGHWKPSDGFRAKGRPLHRRSFFRAGLRLRKRGKMGIQKFMPV